MDESWQKLYDDLKDPNVSKEDKDKIWTFIQNESQRFMEFAYPRIAISDEDKKQIEEMKEKLLKLYVGNGDGYFKDLLGDPMHNEHIVSLKNKKVFISGPMRGYENYNFPKFDRIEKILTDNGIECVNPARISRKFKEVEILNSENKFNEMVRQQQEAEKTCNALLLLDGWQHSKGVMLELKTAIDLDMQILLESDLCNMLRSCQQNTQM